MAKEFDTSAKTLVDLDPVAFLRLAGLPGERATIADTDMSAVQPAADRLLQVSRPRYMAHIEFQTSYDRNLPQRCRSYNVIAGDKYGQDVRTTLYC